MPDVDVAVGFAWSLRARGVPVSSGSTINYARALAEVGIEHPDHVYWAGRATLVHRPEHLAAYDDAFAAFWGGVAPREHDAPTERVVTALRDDDTVDADDDSSVTEPADDVVAVRYSAVEVLRRKDLGACTADELHEAHRLMADLRVVGARRRSRRLRPSARADRAIDLRRTVRESLRSGGEVARVRRRAPGTRPRRVVLLVDVSGSMEPYARALLRFAHAAAAGRRQVEVFTLGTRLTRLTRELATHDPDEALARVSGKVADWSGGTRLGESIKHFNDEWGVRGLARGAVVVILSDGWDRGDPEVLGTELARLRRVAHRIVWVNPLKASPGFAPLARGMAAALPHIDELVEGHSIAALEDLVEVIAS